MRINHDKKASAKKFLPARLGCRIVCRLKPSQHEQQLSRIAFLLTFVQALSARFSLSFCFIADSHKKRWRDGEKAGDGGEKPAQQKARKPFWVMKVKLRQRNFSLSFSPDMARMRRRREKFGGSFCILITVTRMWSLFMKKFPALAFCLSSSPRQRWIILLGKKFLGFFFSLYRLYRILIFRTTKAKLRARLRLKPKVFLRLLSRR
jgi:hypothetical protein